MTHADANQPVALSPSTAHILAAAFTGLAEARSEVDLLTAALIYLRPLGPFVTQVAGQGFALAADFGCISEFLKSFDKTSFVRQSRSHLEVLAHDFLHKTGSRCFVVVIVLSPPAGYG